MPDKTIQDNTTDKTSQENTRRHKTRQDTTRQDTTRQDKTRQDTTRHDKTRQDKTRQDKTRHHKTPYDKIRQADEKAESTTRQSAGHENRTPSVAEGHETGRRETSKDTNGIVGSAHKITSKARRGQGWVGVRVRD
jgi:hypothetical protein